jgi:hypothetical protein
MTCWTGFGNLLRAGIQFYTGDFTGFGRQQVMFYYSGDGHWWLGDMVGGQLQWRFVANTGQPVSESIVVHFKTLIPLTGAVNAFIDTQFDAMADLFVGSDIACYRGTTEDLSGDANLANLMDLDVGDCFRSGPTTAEQDALFGNRNGAGAGDIVIYIVRTLVQRLWGNPLGCALDPINQPGAAIVQANQAWLLAHEVGHVLDLTHVPDRALGEPLDPGVVPLANRRFLMWQSLDWTNPPPDISAEEAATMLASNLTRAC